MASTSSAAMTHHMEDVGRILLQVQMELQGIRESVAAEKGGGGGDGDDDKGGGTNGAGGSFDALEQIIAQAEMDLRSKAEVVLNGLVNKNISTFPALDSNPHDNFGGGGGGGSTSRFGATGTGGGSRRFVSKTQPIANAGANIVSSSGDGKRRT